MAIAYVVSDCEAQLPKLARRQKLRMRQTAYIFFDQLNTKLEHVDAFVLALN